MTSLLTRRTLLAASAAAFAVPLTARAAKPQPVLLELFTSQGCSSCPPADKLAGELAQRSDVIAVSLNVDYWDYLGWRDTLARPEYTQRQRDYAATRGDGEVYTPQMVANGHLHAVGSSRRGVAAMIEQARGVAQTAQVALTVSKSDVRIDVTGAGQGTVWLMAIAPSVKVEIGRGENSGSTIIYHNVVRHLTPAGMWKGGTATFDLPHKAVIGADCTRCLAVVQEGMTGRVLGLDQVKV
jgi:hypothetical protein